MRRAARWLVLALAGLASCVLHAATAVVAVPSAFPTLDPYDATDVLTVSACRSFYEGLVRLGDDGRVEPLLATSWEIDPTGTQYTFHLRKGVRFHDGTPFSARAVQASIERAAAPDSPLRRHILYKDVERVDVVDDLTARIVLKRPFSPFLHQLAHPSGAMISPAALEKYGSRGIARRPVGTGPFVFERWSPADGMRVRRNPDYWRPGLPKLDGIEWKTVPENGTRANMLLTGEAHFVSSLPFEQAERMRRRPGIAVEDRPSAVQRFVSINLLHPPFDDLRVREALNFAVDKKALIKVAFAGMGDAAGGVVPRGAADAADFGVWPYDPDRARKLLAEAGYPQGFSTVLWSGYNHTTALKVIQFLQQQLAQVGVRVSVRTLEPGQASRIAENAGGSEKSPHRLLYTGWSTSTAQADWALRLLFSKDAWIPKGYNTGFYQSAEVDHLLEEVLAARTDEERRSLYRRIQNRIWNDVPWIYLLTERVVTARVRTLHGVRVQADGGCGFEEAWFEEPDRRP